MPRWVPGVYALLCLCCCGLKLRTLSAWGYTGDGLYFDHVLRETLRGHFGLEFSYGNLFGDHAYLFLLALLPLKAVLQSRMIYLFILLGPLAYLLCGLCAHARLAGRFGGARAWRASLGLAVSPFLIPGLLEPAWGFHPDVPAGFLAVAAAACLLTDGDGASPTAIGLMALFASLKEEFALLACLGSGVMALRTRKAGFALAGAAFLLLFLFDLWFMEWNWTLYNRHKGAVARGFLQMISTAPLQPAGAVPLSFYAAAAASSALTGLAWFRLRASPPVLALLVMALPRWGLSFVLGYFSLYDWHNFPTVTMIGGALFLHLAASDPPPRPLLWNAALAASALSALGLLSPKATPGRRGPTDSAEIAALQARVDPMSVTAVDPPTAFAWHDRFRISFFPRGATMSPYGIADALVARKDDAELSRLPACYRKDLETERYALYRRKGPCGGALDASRSYFISRFGASALGP